jgi:arsenite methyltransferase
LKQALLDILVDPESLMPMTFVGSDVTGEIGLTGSLKAGDGEVYPVKRGIPRFVRTTDPGQLQTQGTFGFKWKKKETYQWMVAKGSAATQAAWLLEKYGFKTVEEWARHFSSAARVLDLGCGAGMASWPWLSSDAWTGNTMWVGADISESIETAAELLSSIPNTHFVQADVLRLPFSDGTFDIVISEGVLHHTPSTKDAIAAAARILAPRGELYFYVYRRKGPIREFTDDHVRQAIAGLSDSEAWEVMRSFTQLARKLSELHATIEIDEAVPILGIEAGRQDVQRLIYWNFAKLYWNDAMTLEENTHINFNWYRPTYAHRQSEAEIRDWCVLAGLRIRRFHEQPSGFSVVAVKN